MLFQEDFDSIAQQSKTSFINIRFNDSPFQALIAEYQWLIIKIFQVRLLTPTHEKQSGIEAYWEKQPRIHMHKCIYVLSLIA